MAVFTNPFPENASGVRVIVAAHTTSHLDGTECSFLFVAVIARGSLVLTRQGKAGFFVMFKAHRRTTFRPFRFHMAFRALA